MSFVEDGRTRTLWDADGNIRRRFHFDESSGNTHIETIQDTAPVIDNNRRLQNEPARETAMGRHIASIPLIFVHKWLVKRGVNLLRLRKGEFSREIRLMLNDPDFKFLKTTGKKV